jgi:predicted Zn-dependent protease with MMP-like domain
VSVDVSFDEFEQMVARAVDEIPERLWRAIDNVAFIVEDDPPEDSLHLLGLYDGVPLTERSDYAGMLPDRIFIFRRPTLAVCDTLEEVEDEVRTTVIHEVAHYFGVDDEELDQWGWG